MLKRKMNKISNKIYSIEYYDSIVAINIKSSNLKYSKNIQNNNRLNRYFTDYRFKRVINKKYQRGNSLINFIKSKVSKKGILQRIFENYKIRKYLNKINY